MVGELTVAELVEFEAAFDFTEAWLANRRFAGNTREAYRRDIHQWLRWCAARNLDPLQARFLDVNAWAREMEQPGENDTGRSRKPLAPASVKRKMSAVSSWYAFIVKLGKLQANPAAVADRPKVDRDFSSTASFTREDAQGMLAVAANGDPYLGSASHLLAAWLIQMGTRASETIRIEMKDLGHRESFRVVTLTLKGGKRHRRSLPTQLADLLDKYLTERARREGCSVEQLSGLVFVDSRGEALDRFELARFVRRLARAAKVRNAEAITPHSFRHGWNSMARAAGATLEDRQDAMGHRDPRTTRAYDRAGRSLAHDPALLVAMAVAPRGLAGSDEEDGSQE